MFVLPKGSLVHFGGMPFRLMADVETDGLEVNYKLVVSENSDVLTNPDYVSVNTGCGEINNIFTDEAKNSKNFDPSNALAILPSAYD